MTPFPKLARAKKGETVFFSFIVYRSKAHRDRVNAKVMADPRLRWRRPRCRSTRSAWPTAGSWRSSTSD